MEPLEALPPLNLDLKILKRNSHKLLEYSKLKREICPLIEILKHEPETELERQLCNEDLVDADDESLDVQIQSCKDLLEDLQTKLDSQKNTANTLWNKVLSNHKLLEEKENPSLGFTNASSELIDCLQKLLRAQTAAQDRTNSWISKNILEIRKELVDLWEQCMVGDEVAAIFPAYTAIDFSEELLETHKQELVKWKAYRAKNQKLFDQVEKRAMLWIQMKDLQSKSEDPSRFVNRGGVLLKSQKEMNYVTKALPKAEEKLVALAKNFEKENGRKLLLGGKTIPKAIEDDWKEYKECISKRKHANVSSSAPRLDLPVGLRSAQQNSISVSRRDISELGKTAQRRTMMPMPVVIKRARLDEEFLNLDNENNGDTDQIIL